MNNLIMFITSYLNYFKLMNPLFLVAFLIILTISLCFKFFVDEFNKIFVVNIENLNVVINVLMISLDNKKLL